MKEVGTYVGAGAGLAAFALYGFLPASFLGGIVALSLLGPMSGISGSMGLVGRMIVAGFMVASVIVSGFVFGLVGTLAGRFIGKTLDSLRSVAKVDAKRTRISEPVENRKQERRTVSTVVNLSLSNGECLADITDISVGGARLIMKSCPVVTNGQVVHCRFPDQVERDLRVVWVNRTSGEYLIGVEFVAPTSQESEKSPVKGDQI